MDAIGDFLAGVHPFSLLSVEGLQMLRDRVTLLRYPMGRRIVQRETIPDRLIVLYQGQGRLLGTDPRTQKAIPLAKLAAGSILGGCGLCRKVAGEEVIASEDAIALILTRKDLQDIIAGELAFKTAFLHQCFPVELCDLLGRDLAQRADGTSDLRELVLKVLPEGKVYYCKDKELLKHRGNEQEIIFVSGGDVPKEAIGDRITTSSPFLANWTGGEVRLVGIPASFLQKAIAAPEPESFNSNNSHWIDAIPIAPVVEPIPETIPKKSRDRYPFVYGKDAVSGTLACFKMLAKHLEMPYRGDIVRRVVLDRIKKQKNLTLEFCAAVGDVLELQVQLVETSLANFPRLPLPGLIVWGESFALLYDCDRDKQEMILGIPEAGIQRYSLTELESEWGSEGKILLFSKTSATPQDKFGLSWFVPALSRYRGVLTEVFIASFFVQLFALVNPLMTQQIIDKVIVKNAPDTLPVFGVVLLVVAIVEAILTTLRTYLFIDTTNRIDFGLGSEIIDHLLRLPMRYFSRRPVGEISSRVNELENIRKFLTGTALTVVLDSLFSVIYIGVMLLYSPMLTLVALGVIPIFIGLTLLVSPLVRRRLQEKAERNAQTQSYLVEVLNGMETVKAQNIEMRSRFSWQEKYGRYIVAGFKAMQLATIAGSLNGFLNKLSSLLVLWVGAGLVLEGNLTLGELIAFRIISSYVTSPLLRLSQLWQNFQETALSLERLGDIVNHPQESEGRDRDNLPMPMIQGTVKYEDISFRFGNSGALQLNGINLEVAAGSFVGVVGQSGSGKSTLIKLLARLYEPLGGRILLDRYDIQKVELYSLRSQLGIVPQNTLLFDGTVKDNIALTQPEATFEEIERVAKLAVAHEFIMELPNGYNTQVGERGANLSGGQRQRIAIARTILQNPRLLILDEATSALDAEIELNVCKNLKAAFKDRTVFFITHRLGTIKNSDTILMLDRGRLIERGTHEELMQLNGSYCCLFKKQAGDG